MGLIAATKTSSPMITYLALHSFRLLELTSPPKRWFWTNHSKEFLEFGLESMQKAYVEIAFTCVFRPWPEKKLASRKNPNWEKYIMEITQGYKQTSNFRRSASGNEIRRPPYCNRIWPGIADSDRKTPFPALRIVDIRTSHADKKCSRDPLYFLESLIASRDRW